MKWFLLITIVLPLVAAASVVDPLYTSDYARVGIKGLVFDVSPTINLNNAMYDTGGNKVDTYATHTYKTNIVDYQYSSRDIWIPVKLGYHFDESFSAGVVVPIAILNQKETKGTVIKKESNTTLGNTWIWGRGSHKNSDDLIIGPRIGIKLPFGAYTRENRMRDYYSHPDKPIKSITGDKNLSLDMALLFAYRPVKSFLRLDAELAGRYNMEGRYQWTTTTDTGTRHYDEWITPGITMNFLLAPGVSWGAKGALETYAQLEYETQVSNSSFRHIYSTPYSYDTASTYGFSSVGGNILSCGLRQIWSLNSHNHLQCKFMYDIHTVAGYHYLNFEHEVNPAGMSVAIGYSGYIPM